jgi:hypothetical protein
LFSFVRSRAFRECLSQQEASSVRHRPARLCCICIIFNGFEKIVSGHLTTTHTACYLRTIESVVSACPSSNIPQCDVTCHVSICALLRGSQSDGHGLSQQLRAHVSTFNTRMYLNTCPPERQAATVTNVYKRAYC